MKTISSPIHFAGAFLLWLCLGVGGLLLAHAIHQKEVRDEATRATGSHSYMWVEGEPGHPVNDPTAPKECPADRRCL